MVTAEDLNKLIPNIVKEIAQSKPDIKDKYVYATSTYDDDDVEFFEEARDWFCYEEDEWYFEVYYKCEGKREWGDLYWSGYVTNIMGRYEDPETGEVTRFSEDDLLSMMFAIDDEIGREQCVRLW